MSDAPFLLNDDGSASLASALLMSQHGLRRDLARFSVAVGQLRSEDHARAELLRAQWKSYHEMLWGPVAPGASRKAMPDWLEDA